MKKLTALLLTAAIMLTGCRGAATSSSGGLTADQVFSGGSGNSGEPPAAMVELTPQELVDNIRIGWNLGLALENCLTPDDPEDAVANETLRGNPPASSRLFERLVDCGVNAVRLPITWRDHTDDEGNVDETWFNRVRQVVNYAYDSGMYVIITMYHDGDSGSWLDCAASGREAALARYQRIWQQISEKFSGYNERVLFESVNSLDFSGVSEDGAYDLLNDINQLFVNTVRSSGGNNPWRHLLISGYNADIMCSSDERFVMPEDPSERCILSVHYYIPVTFCTDGIQDKWGSNSDQIWMRGMVEQLRENFTDKGVPAMITEYGTAGSDQPSRVFYCEMLTKLCRDAGIAAFLWDDGSEYDRKDFTWTTPGLIKALRRASGSTDYTPVKQKNLLQTSDSTGE